MSKVKRVVLVPGHDFQSQGCHTTLLDGTVINEYELVTRLVTDVFKEEQLRDIDLIVKGRNTLRDLPDEINTLNADIVISCHLNAFNEATQGTEVLYAKGSKKGEALAADALAILNREMGLHNRGLKEIKLGDRGGYVLVRTLAPCILIEPFFLDNFNDAKVIELYYQRMKKALSKIIIMISEKY